MKQQAVIFSISLASLFVPLPAFSQTITPANDGTGTIVIQQGSDRFEIQGGSFSSDGHNLFHSFKQFGLSANQVANFLAQPNIHNILGRVVGGDPSFINGLLQVSGSNANLYLMNPAGIVFGSGASLNIGGDFLATTAEGIGFRNGGWFNAVGSNDYNALIGTPNQFAFDSIDAGSIINAGNLETPGNLSLLAGEVVNSGGLNANTVTVYAVPDSQLVRISQPNHLLSLEVLPPRDAQGNVKAIAPLDLPKLLTGGNTGLSTNAQGAVQFDPDEVIPVQAGTAIAAGTIQAKEVNILGDQVAVLKQIKTPKGGSVRIGGDYLGGGPVPNAKHTYVSPHAEIQSDQGRVIVWSDDVTRFFGTIDAAGGFVETSGKDYLEVIGATVNAAEWLLDPRNVTIAAVTAGGTFSGGNPDVFTPTADNATINVTDITNALAAGNNVTITTGSTGSQDGNITVASAIAPGTVNGNLTLTLTAANDIAVNAPITNADPVDTHALNVTFNAGRNIDVNANITTGGGNITMNSTGGNIDTTGITLSSADNNAGANIALGGNVILTAVTPGGVIDTGDIDASAAAVGADATGGNVILTAGGNITFGNIDITANATAVGPAVVARTGSIIINANTNPATTTTTSTTLDPSLLDEQSEDCFGAGCADRALGQRKGDYPWLTAYCLGDEHIAVESIEEHYSQEYADYLELASLPPIVDSDQAKGVLHDVVKTTGQSTAVIYMEFCPNTLATPLEGELEQHNLKQVKPDSHRPVAPGSKVGIASHSLKQVKPGVTTHNFSGDRDLLNDGDRLVLLLVQPNQDPIRYPVNVSRGEVREMGRRLRRTVTNPRRRDAYLEPAQTLYSWILEPLEAELRNSGIDHLAYVPVSGLRTIPFAALHDGNDFAIARYSLSILPSLSLTNPNPHSLHEAEVLGMGVETFATHPPLPAVPLELGAIAPKPWPGAIYLNENFTYANLLNARQAQPYDIVHLATHSRFQSGTPDDSYIQLWERSLSLAEARELDWQLPLVELLVLSACETAFGDADAELGFTGLAVAAGVKSAVGSLWTVSDTGTLGFMAQFYQTLRSGDRATALQQTQLAMSRGQVNIVEDELRLLNGAIELSPEILGFAPDDLSHPFYWAAFTLVGSPW